MELPYFDHEKTAECLERDAQQIEEVINKYGLNDLPEATVQSILEHMRGLADWHREQAGGKSKS